MIHITIWNEYVHERESQKIAEVYPEGIHGCIAGFLKENADMEIRTATLDMPEHGLTEEVLAWTDVLIWWGHMKHHEVSEEVAERVKKHVLQGMGFIPLHSAHHSKPMRYLMGTTCNLRWRDDDRELMWCVNPAHPIAAGIPVSFEIKNEEMYGEQFDIPTPDELVFLGWFAGGEVMRSGCTFTRGRGKIFYFQPGHEEFPTYKIPEIQHIITNAVRWAVPTNRTAEPLKCVDMAEKMISFNS